MFMFQDQYDGYMMDICQVFRMLWDLHFGTLGGVKVIVMYYVLLFLA